MRSACSSGNDKRTIHYRRTRETKSRKPKSRIRFEEKLQPKQNSLAEPPESDNVLVHWGYSLAGGHSMTFSVESFVLRLKRADTPFFRRARHILDFCFTANMPVPKNLKPAGRLLYEVRFYAPVLWKRLKSLLYTTPMFSCRCESVGKRLQLVALPSVSGHTALYIGDDVRVSGSLAIASGRFYSKPILRIGNRAFIGHNVSITCNREVIIEDDVLIS